MSKKYIGYLAVYMIVMLAITVLGTVLQFSLIGIILPIWHWKYSAFEAGTIVAFMWMLLPVCYLFMADGLRALQELEEEETSE